MEGGGNITKMRESSLYQDMFKDIIKNQIQLLIEQLANAGEESILLTSNIIHTTEFADETIIGSELGQTFIQGHENVKSLFRIFCVQNCKKKDFHSSNVANSGKRKLAETNGEVNDQCVKTELITPGSMCKKSRTTSMSSSDSRDTSIVESYPRIPLYTLETDMTLPKGHTRCSICQYHSNFKANVLRHERSVHGLHMDGACSPSVQYTCAVCSYKSLFRSNVMRHERNVHKLISSAMDLENRKVPYNQAPDFIVKTKEQTYFVPGSVDHSGQFMATGHQSDYNQFLAQSPGNQSYQYVVNENATISGGNFAGDGNHYSAQQNIRNDSLDSAEHYVDSGCHICNYCQEILPTIEQLRSHIEQFHVNSDECKCEKCSQTFHSLFNLQEHMATHNALKQEKCVCGKMFQYKTSLIRHQKKCEHSGTDQEKSDHDTSLEEIEERNDNQDIVQIEQTQEVLERNSNQDVVRIENELEEFAIMNIKSVQVISQNGDGDVDKNISENDCDITNVKPC